MLNEFDSVNNSTSDEYNYVKEPNPYSLHYKLNKITKAPANTLGVFCFKTLDDAKDFDNFWKIHNRIKTTIFECKGYNKISLKNGILSSVINKGFLDLFYNDKISDKENYLYFNSRTAPDEFICFESIKPIKVVE
jgi:hypothetical protein